MLKYLLNSNLKSALFNKKSEQHLNFGAFVVLNMESSWGVDRSSQLVGRRVPLPRCTRRPTEWGLDPLKGSMSRLYKRAEVQMLAPLH